MIIKPRVRGFMCVTSHPAGCAMNVQRQIEFVRERPFKKGPKRVLVIGASTGYGLAARVAAAFGSQAATIGVFFEKMGNDRKPGTAGWYNSAAFHQQAEKAGIYAKSVNGDAFSDGVKQRTIAAIKEDLGQIDLVIYSLASPRRQHPETGQVYQSTLKPIGKEVTMLGVNTDRGVVQEFTLNPATDDEIHDTVAVMGGDDWQRWIQALADAGALAAGAKVTAFTYIGEQITWDLYWHGTIGRAKQDLDTRVLDIRQQMAEIGGDARVSVLKAVVTQSSSAIPIMPLYLAILFREMKRNGSHEGCIEQIHRLFTECLYSDQPRLDETGRLRVDDRELQPHIQKAVADAWRIICDENFHELADFSGYQSEFLKLFGFAVEGIDYAIDVELDVPITHLI